MKKTALLVAVLLFAALVLSSCIVVPAVKESAPPTVSATQTTPVTPEPVATAVATAIPTATPSPTPVPMRIQYTAIENIAVQKFMLVQVGKPLADALAILGDPLHIYGQGAYQYTAIAGNPVCTPAAVYRFSVANVPLELIVSTIDDRVLKKQISTPDVMPKLTESISSAKIPDGTSVADALKLTGANPYLWMEFLAPDTKESETAYQVAVWPDASGQLAALVKDGIVLRSEYQPDGIALSAAKADAVTPRVPRFLKPRPSNANGKVTSFALFKKFAAIKLNASEQSIVAVFGEPTSQDTSDPSVRVLRYQLASANFSDSKVEFSFSLSAGESGVLVAKRASLLPLADAELRARYAPQLLPGMLKTEVEAFMGSGFFSDTFIDADGRTITSYTWAGDKACVRALIPQGDKTVVGNNFSYFDADAEAATLYEEYVIPPLKGLPKPKITPAPHTPGITFIPVTIIPLPTPTKPRPSKSFIIPSLTFKIPKITPTPVIIK